MKDDRIQIIGDKLEEISKREDFSDEWTDAGEILQTLADNGYQVVKIIAVQPDVIKSFILGFFGGLLNIFGGYVTYTYL